MKKIQYIVLLFFLLTSCGQKKGTEKLQSERANIIHVREQVEEIEIDSVLFSSLSHPYIISDFLIIADFKSYDQYIHIFNKNDFHYIASIAYMGRGPGEITSLGYVGINEFEKKIELTDLGKQIIFSIDLDSAINNPSYIPQKKTEIIGETLLYSYQYINKDVCMGLILEPTGSSDYKVTVGTQNKRNSKLKEMPYTHPAVNNKRVSFAASPKNGVYVECYKGQNLITICSLDGELKYNIYGGRNWRENQQGRKEFFQKVAFVHDKIFALFLESDRVINHPVRGLVGNLATKFLVFDQTGNYLATLEIGYHIMSFCYDEENNRIIFSLNDDIQFAYLDLDGII